jgi:4-amino-4-deoxy-L-arabinose transferase-like glycosyltransferase
MELMAVSSSGELESTLLAAPDPPRAEYPSPVQRPAWTFRYAERLALVAVLTAAAVLYLWRLSHNGYGNLFYAAAVRSMTRSWHNFFYGAFDPGGFITVDKPPLALWVQAVSAKIFGFGSWSLLVPQAAAGVASVYVLYRIVRRQAGRAAGLVAALALTLTPITVAVNRDNNPDTMMILLLLLAAWAVQAALQRGGFGRLALAGMFVGLAFTTKMLAAYLVVPGLAGAFFVAAAASWKRRVVNLLGAGIVLVTVSGAWMTIVDAVPKARRPYVGGSTNDTVSNLAFSYNGVGRLTGGAHNSLPAAVRPGTPVARAGLHGRSGTGLLLNHAVAGQIAWLIPFAVLTLLAGLAATRRRPADDPTRAALIMWGGWSAGCWMVFSYSKGIFHPYYTAELAPGLAALAGIGVATMARLARRRGRWVLLFAAGVLANAALQVVILRRTPTWHPWLQPTTIVAGTLCAALAVAALGGRRLSTSAGAAVGITTVVALLTAPAAYATTAVENLAGGFPAAGPVAASPLRAGADSGRRPATFLRNGTINPAILTFLVRNQGASRYLVAVTGDAAAQATIIHTGLAVLPMGGFGGGDPVPTVPGLVQLVRTRRLRFVIINSSARGPSLSARRNTWVERTCAPVAAAAYTHPAQRARVPHVLYDCGA